MPYRHPRGDHLSVFVCVKTSALLFNLDGSSFGTPGIPGRGTHQKFLLQRYRMGGYAPRSFPGPLSPTGTGTDQCTPRHY
jgi:hypothetical protein